MEVFIFSIVVIDYDGLEILWSYFSKNIRVVLDLDKLIYLLKIFLENGKKKKKNGGF